MNSQRIVGRIALRQLPPSLRHFATSRPARSISFQSYPLSPGNGAPPPRGDEIPESSIAQPTTSPSARPAKPAETPSISTKPSASPSPSHSPSAEAPRPTQSAAASSFPAKVSESQAQQSKPVRPRPKIRARKAAMKLTPTAVERLRALLDQPDPKLIRVGVRNRGCSGLAYHLEYVEKPGAFDEEVVQDGVKMLIDSKALFSIIGSEMDWVEDKLSQKFVFRNPNIKEECGCGESFMV